MCVYHMMELKCYKYNSRGKQHIGTSFPSAVPLDQNKAAAKIQFTYRGKSTCNQLLREWTMTD